MVIMVLFLSSLSRIDDLLVLIETMLRPRGLDTVRITKVKGHADQGMVWFLTVGSGNLTGWITTLLS